MPISTVPVRGVKGMISEHVLSLFRQIPPRRLVDVFIMSKREVDLIEPAIRFVNTILGLVAGNLAIRVGGKEFWENDLIRVSAGDREGIAHHCPLGLPIQAEHFSKIMYKASENEPTRVTILANCFGGLKEMFDLREIGIGVAVVHKGVQILGHFPNAFFVAIQATVFRFLAQDKIKRLAGVVLTVKLRYGGIGVGLIVAEFLFRLALTIAGGYKIIPLVDPLERGVISAVSHADAPKTRIMSAYGLPRNSGLS